MSNQVLTPAALSMPQIVIPAVVSPLGPRLTRLPDELILEIFRQLVTSLFPPKSRFNTVITVKDFAILNRHYAINRIRNVSTGFANLFTQAFYENFNFEFKHSQIYNPFTHYLTAVPAPIPAQHFRHHLRSMHIEIVCQNYYFNALEPGESPKGRKINKITSSDELLAHCPAARQLYSLTNPLTGFSNLAVLDLYIRSDFSSRHPVDDDFLDAFDEANIVVTAGRVKLVVTNSDGDVKPEHLEIKRRIRVRGVGEW
ncbi:hypothetical protein EJ07DRAFT_154713 [Lizonia empirigonia]|nr:hypothetical protein EJ07DRAFT_154713 [Lizonia empirigonia]